MAVEIQPAAAVRIAELLDLFAELPSTPPVLTEEARQHAVTLLDAVEEAGSDLRGPGRGHATFPPGEHH